MSRNNPWFVLAEGIAREVITADIQRYLGPDALVRPGMGTGEFSGQRGYYITACRNLTPAMIEDLKLNSQRWQQAQQSGTSQKAYQDSRTHAAPYDYEALQPPRYARDSLDHRTPPRGFAEYGSDPIYGSEAHYAPSTAAPTTELAYPQTEDSQNGEAHPSRYYYPYPSQPRSDAYGRSEAPSSPYTSPSAPSAPCYYGASDGRQYAPSSQYQQPSRHSRSEYRRTRERATAGPQPTTGVLAETSQAARTTAASTTDQRYGKRSDDMGKGAGGMTSPCG